MSYKVWGENLLLTKNYNYGWIYQKIVCEKTFASAEI